MVQTDAVKIDLPVTCRVAAGPRRHDWAQHLWGPLARGQTRSLALKPGFTTGIGT
jgi:hypothetical protein